MALLYHVFSACPKNHYLCKSSRCVEFNMLCDGNNDCGECDFVGPDCIASDEGSIWQGNCFAIKIGLKEVEYF